VSTETRRVMICNLRGLHARAAAKFVETARDYDSVIHVTREGETVNADSIMELLMLAAGKGAQIDISSSGTDAEQAANALVKLVESGFYEDD
jgi:phosphocarrier protein HPr